MLSTKTISVGRLRSSAAAASNGDDDLLGPILMCDVVTIDDMDSSQIDSNADAFTMLVITLFPRAKPHI